MHHVMTQGRAWAVEVTRRGDGYRAAQPQLGLVALGETPVEAVAALGARLEDFERDAVRRHAQQAVRYACEV